MFARSMLTALFFALCASSTPIPAPKQDKDTLTCPDSVHNVVFPTTPVQTENLCNTNSTNFSYTLWYSFKGNGRMVTISSSPSANVKWIATPSSIEIVVYGQKETICVAKSQFKRSMFGTVTFNAKLNENYKVGIVPFFDGKIERNVNYIDVEVTDSGPITKSCPPIDFDLCPGDALKFRPSHFDEKTKMYFAVLRVTSPETEGFIRVSRMDKTANSDDNSDIVLKLLDEPLSCVYVGGTTRCAPTLLSLVTSAPPRLSLVTSAPPRLSAALLGVPRASWSVPHALAGVWTHTHTPLLAEMSPFAAAHTHHTHHNWMIVIALFGIAAVVTILTVWITSRKKKEIIESSVNDEKQTLIESSSTDFETSKLFL